MYDLDELFNEAAIDSTDDGISVFMEGYEDFKNLQRMHDAKVLQLAAYVESAMSEFQINIKKSELKCMKEHGTDDDLAFLENAAEEGFIGKVKNVIRKLIELFNNFINELKIRVTTKITSMKTKKVIAEVEKMIRLNPALGKEVVQIPDRRKQLKIIDLYIQRAERMSARVVRGLYGTHQIKGLVATIDEYREQFGRAIDLANVGLMTITIAALVLKTKGDVDGLPRGMEWVQNYNSQVLENMALVFDEEAVAYARAAMIAIANMTEDGFHHRANMLTQTVYDCMFALDRWYRKKKGLAPKGGPIIYEGPYEFEEPKLLKKLKKRDPLYYGESGEDGEEESNELLESLDTFLESSGIYVDDYE